MPSTARAACINLNGQADIYDPQKRYVRRGTGILPVHTLYIWGSSFELDASCSFLLSLISKENAFSPTTQSFTASTYVAETVRRRRPSSNVFMRMNIPDAYCLITRRDISIYSYVEEDITHSGPSPPDRLFSSVDMAHDEKPRNLTEERQMNWRYLFCSGNGAKES